jgi:methionyl-tRNA synthetase
LVVLAPTCTATGALCPDRLAGSLLAADICTRFARANGREVLFGTGLQVAHTTVASTARQLGLWPENLRDRWAEGVRRSLAGLGIETDGFGRLDGRFATTVLTFFGRLHNLRRLRLRRLPLPYSLRTDRYLSDTEVVGSCPSCLSECPPGWCGTCAYPIAPWQLIDPRSTLDPQDRVELRTARVLVFPVEEYRAELSAYFAARAATLHPRLARLVERLLSRRLADYPVTMPVTDGIPAPFPEVAGQVIHAAAEAMPWSLHVTALAAKRRGAALPADDAPWFADAGASVVYFHGLDTAYPLAVVGTAMLMALGGYVLPEQFVTDGPVTDGPGADGPGTDGPGEPADELSTGGNGQLGAVWALAAQAPRDLVRFHMAATSSQTRRTAFTPDALAKASASRLVEPWNRVVDTAARWAGYGPLPVSGQARAAAADLTAGFAAAYDVHRFSLTAAAGTLAGQLARLASWDARPAEAGDFCHQVQVFLACAGPILVDLSARTLPGGANPNATEVTPTPLRRLARFKAS